jgi:hypothetical protein
MKCHLGEAFVESSTVLAQPPSSLCSFHQIGHNSYLRSPKDVLFVACETRLPKVSNHVYHAEGSIKSWIICCSERITLHLLTV